jgi:thiol:disulfide interchange protein DsbC
MTAAAALLATVAHADPEYQLPDAETLLENAPNREAVIQVGQGPFAARELPDGRLVLVSSNGRFIVPGPVTDMWTGEHITTIDALDRAVNRADLSDVDLAAHGARFYGKDDAPTVVIFVDPACPWCHRLMTVIRERPDFLESYRLALIPVAVLGPNSDLMLTSIECRMSSEEADAWFWDLGNRPYPPVDRGTPHCNPDSVASRVNLMQLLEIAGVPFLIAPDGRKLAGFRQDFLAWLEGE